MVRTLHEILLRMLKTRLNGRGDQAPICFPECRWGVMFTDIAAVYDHYREVYRQVFECHKQKAPQGYEQVKQQCFSTGGVKSFPLSYYEQTEERLLKFTELCLNEIVVVLEKKIDKAIEKMQKPKYYESCGDKPINVLLRIKEQIAKDINIHGPPYQHHGDSTLSGEIPTISSGTP